MTASTPTPTPTTRRIPIPVVTGRLVVLAAALILPVALVEVLFPGFGLMAVLVGFVVLVALWLLDLLLAVPVKVLQAERQVASPLMLGSEAQVTWVVTNPTQRTARFWLHDGAAPSLCARPGRLDVTVPGGETVQSAYVVVPVRRGKIAFQGPVIRSFGPLGLGGKQTAWVMDETVLVNPAFPSRKVAELRLDDARRMFAGQRAVRILGDSSEFDYLREYTPDDDIRHINWAASARSQSLIVEQTRAERNQQVVVLLDHSRLSAPTTRRFTPAETVFDGPVVDLEVVERETLELDNAPRLDHFIDATLALGLVASGMGDRFGVITYAGEVTNVLTPNSGRTHNVALSRMMADVLPNWEEPDPLAAATWLMTHWKRRSLVIIMTDLAAEHARTRLAQAITRMSRTHQILVASPADPTVAMWAKAMPVDERGAMRMIAAQRALQRRNDTARMLSRMGVRVVDTPPGYLAGHLLDAYLESSDLSAGSRVNITVQRGWASQLGHHSS